MLDLYHVLGNIALVFAAQVSRDSEIAGISTAGSPVGKLSGLAIAVVVHFLDRSLSSRLTQLFMGCFGDCLNHGFSLIQRITRITGSLSRSLSSRLILLFSKIELVFSTIMVSNTTYAVPAGRDSEMESLWSCKSDHNLTDCGTEIYDLT